MIETLRAWARALRRETLALWFAARDVRTPWLARALLLAVVAYAASPIDLIPDFIPILGYLDDLLLLPLGVWLALRLVPPEVMAAARARAAHEQALPGALGRHAAIVVVTLWIAAAALLALWLLPLTG